MAYKCEWNGEYMKILSENETTVVDMQCDFEEEEFKLLIKYADDNMTEDDLLNMKLNWSFIEILKNMVNEESIQTEGEVETC